MDRKERVKLVKIRINKELRKLGFANGQGTKLRKLNGVFQGIGFTRNRSENPEEYEIDLQIWVMSPTAHELIYGVKTDQLWASQISTTLSDICGLESWVFTTDQEADLVAESINQAFRSCGLAFLDSLKSDEAILVKALEPRLGAKAQQLHEWELDVYHGKASRSDRPGLSAKQIEAGEVLRAVALQAGLVELPASKARREGKKA